MRTSAPTRQEKIETTIRNPKNLNGMKPDVNNTRKPIITEKALKMIPRPVVVRVFLAAS